MLNSSTPIPTLAVKDLDAARQFYEQSLGLEVQDEIKEAQVVTFRSGEGELQIYVSDTAGSNKATYVTWRVDDIDEVVDDLKAEGVKFEQYPDMPEVSLEGDIHVWENMRAAWFKDPDGNVLCVHQTD